MAGTIGATPNNELGVTGLTLNSTLFGYAANSSQVPFRSNFRMKHALATMFANDARIVNVSLGTSAPFHANHIFDINQEIYFFFRNEAEILTTFLRTYLDRGHKFLIVQSAGNNSHSSRGPGGLFAERFSWIHTGYNGIFVNIDDPDIKDRIIVVGNMEQRTDYRTADLSFGYRFTTQIGSRVDIFAPGANICGTAALLRPFDQLDLTYVNTHYDSLYGTSMAAPHVTGTAAMVWALNPDLTGAQVKDIIVNRAYHNYITITIDVHGDIQIFPALCAGSAVEYTVAGVVGEGRHSRDYNTVFGIVRLYEERDTLNSAVSAEIEIYKWTDDRIVRVEYAAVDNNIVPTPILTRRLHPYNTFEITLPRGMYKLIVSNVENRQAVYTYWLDLNYPVPFQILELRKGYDLTIMADGVKVTSPPLPFLYPRPILIED